MTDRAALPLIDRVYARAFAMTGYEDPGSAARDLIALASSPHVLGRVRERIAAVVHDNPLAEAPRGALHLVTRAWVLAIEEG